MQSSVSAVTHLSALHPPTALPDRVGHVDSSVNDFLLFLLHLYFPSYYRYPPFAPKVHLNLTNADHVHRALFFPTALQSVVSVVAVNAYSAAPAADSYGPATDFHCRLAVLGRWEAKLTGHFFTVWLSSSPPPPHLLTSSQLIRP
jgi:hypothetical protein